MGIIKPHFMNEKHLWTTLGASGARTEAWYRFLTRDTNTGRRTNESNQLRHCERLRKEYKIEFRTIPHRKERLSEQEEEARQRDVHQRLSSEY